MLGWIARVLIVFAGFITSWFVARDALNFNFIQMVVGVFMFTFMVMIVSFWPILQKHFQKIINWFKKVH